MASDVFTDLKPSVLDYARFHGLTTDYLSESPLYCTRLCDISAAEDAVTSLPDVSPERLLSNIDCLTERLSISASALLFLKEVCTEPECSPMVTSSRQPLSGKYLKHELPLLRTDNELDLLHFGRQEDLRNAHIGVTPALVNVDLDEGLTWPSKYYSQTTEIHSQAREEKLEITSASLHFLKDMVTTSLEKLDSIEFDQTDLQHRKTQRSHTLTPPLLPISPPPAPFAPGPSGEDLKALIDTTDHADMERKSIERYLMQGDSYLQAEPGVENEQASGVPREAEAYLLDVIEETPPATVSPKRRVKDLKIEGPLTPPLPSDYPNKRAKTISFSQMFHEYVQELPSAVMSREDLGLTDADVANFITEQISPLAAEAIQALQNESLVEADTTKRVKVPDIKSKPIKPPWEMYSRMSTESRSKYDTDLDAQCGLLRHMKSSELDQFRRWHGNAGIERQLRWTPFPMERAKPNLTETIDADTELNVLIAGIDISATVSSCSLTWKRQLLRTLDAIWDEDEEELLPGDFDAADMRVDDFIQKRVSADQKASIRLTEFKGVSVPSLIRPLMPDSQYETRGLNASDLADNGLLFGGRMFTPTEIRTALTADPKDVLSSTSRTPGHPMTMPPAGDESLDTELKANTSDEFVRSDTGSAKLSHPEVPSRLTEQHFIVCANTLNTNKALFRVIERLWPLATFIEREWVRPGNQKMSQPGVQDPAPDEGDIIASPSTAIILTTLARARQKPLPGQESSFCGVKDRIAVVASRFERIVVLVHEASTASGDMHHILDERDSVTMAELNAYTTNVNAEVQILYVPGNETALGKWTVAILNRYATRFRGPETNPPLLQEQTLWEQFLRRLGMNSFAAQAILIALRPVDPIKPPETSSDPIDNEYVDSSAGLTSFVRMSPDERIQRLSPILGGNKLLIRASNILEQAFSGLKR